MYKALMLAFSLFVLSCNDSDGPMVDSGVLQLASVRVGTTDLSQNETIEQLPLDENIIISFNLPLNKSILESSIFLSSEDNAVIEVSYAYLDDDKTVAIKPSNPLTNNKAYLIQIGEVKSTTGEVFPGADYRFKTKAGDLDIVAATINGQDLLTNSRIADVPLMLNIEITFSASLSADYDFSNDIKIGTIPLSFDLSTDQKTLEIKSIEEVEYLTRYTLFIDSEFTNESQFVFGGFEKDFSTQIDTTPKFPQLSDADLLTKIQEQTFKYFYDFAHPVSGLARERNTSGNAVTIGGSGFGVMVIIVGIERGFITRHEGIDRLETIINFLETADRFHGVWPHWMHGNTGKTIPFSANDDGADLVETSFMIQGLMTARQYLDENIAQEKTIIDTINKLVDEVEWDWFTQGDQDQLYWHWSPNFGWEKNLAIRGWNESLIVYVLAAASETYSIDKAVYDNGWARSGEMRNTKSSEYYDYQLPLRTDMGGPLFFSHYSFLGLDPRNLEDPYANYWEQNRIHSLINRAYCVDNPRNYLAYSEDSWGLTASDGDSGYSAHSPNNDRGVITPTAAISAIPYTPEESMQALKFFYYIIGDRLWGDYGFYDAFNATEGWYADSYLAIDQGPIVCMIENYRTGLLWDLFMSAPEVKNGLDKLGFTSY